MTKKALLWFRQDLRLKDNTALIHAVENGYEILPVFILDDENAEEWRRGGAQKWWLHKSLQLLNDSMGGNLIFRKGKADEIISSLVEETQAEAVFWNRCYEPWRINRDKAIKEKLKDKNIAHESFKDFLLWEPWEVSKDDGDPYRVFTPFYRKGCLKTSEPAAFKSTPQNIKYAEFHERHDISHLDLLPEKQWYRKFESHWQPGEQGAQDRLETFLNEGLAGYKEDRNRPDMEKVSRLSPYLHHGEISPREVWHKARAAGIDQGVEKDMDHFCSELGWREFSYSLLYHFPKITWENLQTKFNDFPWISQKSNDLKRWQKGQTGIPIVDAGMRQLYETGWMHNRVRMIVASLLVKNMLIHWHRGEEWFWDCLFDADLANNSASWQWVAGCGADAAPYFRIFNPVTQGEKFDPEGKYVREYVPELAHMENKYLHKPWESPNPPAGYPAPIVDLKASREKALEAFQSIKKAA